MAQKVVSFFVSDAEADDKLGEGVGWLVGNIGFQLLLDFFSAGSWEGISGVLKVIAKFLNWPMEVMGAAFKLLKRLGGLILDGVKSLGRMVVEAGGGALRKVLNAFGSIGEKLMSFAERLLGKFGGAAAREGEHIAGAVSVPFYDPSPYFAALPKDTWLVCYCACPHAESGQLAQQLGAQGFTKVAVLDEGLGVWKARGYPVTTSDAGPSALP